MKENMYLEEDMDPLEEISSIGPLSTGVVGMDFDPYMRYAVTGHIHKMVPALAAAFSQAAVSY